MLYVENKGDVNEKDIISCLERDKKKDGKKFTLLGSESNLAKGLRKQREDGRYLDCVIVCGTLRMDVHLCVMASFSDYFDALLHFEERQQEQQPQESTLKTFRLDLLNSNAVKVLIEYAYQGEISVDSEDVLEILRAADYLCLTRVSEECCEYLLKSLDVENCLMILESAHSLNNTKLIIDVKQYILKNFSQVSACTEFLNLKPDILNDLIQDSDLTVVEKYQYETSYSIFFVPPCRQEELILKAVLRYVEYNPERIELLPRILTQGVRLPLISPKVLLTYKYHSLLAGSSNLVAILDKAIELSTALVDEASNRITILINNIVKSSTVFNNLSVVDDDAETNIASLFEAIDGLNIDSQANELSSAVGLVSNQCPIIPDQVIKVSSTSDADQTKDSIGSIAASLHESDPFNLSSLWTNPRNISSKTFSYVYSRL